LETIVSAEITDIIAAENNHGHGLPHQTLLHAFHCQGYKFSAGKPDVQVPDTI
jgi:hypothetical protein